MCRMFQRLNEGAIEQMAPSLRRRRWRYPAPAGRVRDSRLAGASE